MADNRSFASHKKATGVVLAIIITTSVSGFFMGLRQTASHVQSSSPAEPASVVVEDSQSYPDVPEIVEYSKLSRTNYKANANWMNHLANHVEKPAPLGPDLKNTGADREKSNNERASRRAYDGAPPTIPHRIDQVSSASCLACHSEGKIIKDKTASKISHPYYSNCTQCHVPSVGTELPENHFREAIAGNDFLGKPAPGKGVRAYFGAPPTIPHPTLMRSDCMSCHGPKGAFGLKTSHPERQSCQQCHAPLAEMDQREFALEMLQTNERTDALPQKGTP